MVVRQIHVRAIGIAYQKVQGNMNANAKRPGMVQTVTEVSTLVQQQQNPTSVFCHVAVLLKKNAMCQRRTLYDFTFDFAFIWMNLLIIYIEIYLYSSTFNEMQAYRWKQFMHVYLKILPRRVSIEVVGFSSF